MSRTALLAVVLAFVGVIATILWSVPLLQQHIVLENDYNSFHKCVTSEHKDCFIVKDAIVTGNKLTKAAGCAQSCWGDEYDTYAKYVDSNKKTTLTGVHFEKDTKIKIYSWNGVETHAKASGGEHVEIENTTWWFPPTNFTPFWIWLVLATTLPCVIVLVTFFGFSWNGYKWDPEPEECISIGGVHLAMTFAFLVSASSFDLVVNDLVNPWICMTAFIVCPLTTLAIASKKDLI